MVLFKVNDLIEFVNEGRTERILWISSEYEYCYSIVMYLRVLDIRQWNMDDLEDYFNDDLIEIIAPNVQSPREDKLTEKSRSNMEEAWKAIKDIVCTANIPDVFDGSLRSKLVNQATEQHSTFKSSIYKYLRKYWQGGMLKISLAPDFNNCGGKGKEKSLGEIKVGRKNEISELEPEKVGVNINEETKEQIKKIIVRYRYNKRRRASVHQAYTLFKNEYCSETKIIEGVEKKVPNEDHTIITESQFKYWYYKLKDSINEYESKEGTKKLNLNARPLKSNAKHHAYGPGFRYEIDSTIPPFYLLNRIKDEPIGKPVNYCVIDTSTTFIAGIHVGVGYASWEGACLALYNCTEDKVEFCRRYGIEIKPEQWPNSGLPQFLLADRGELAGVLPEKAIENLNICLENTPSYRADLKGTVERNFGLQESKLKLFLDGVIEKDFRERGGSDARKNADMNIEEYTRSYIRVVIHHNNHVMKNYIKSQQMIDQNVNPIPAELFTWGQKNMSGIFRTYPENYVKMNLMRAGKATITEYGIRFQKYFYDCEVANLEKWYYRARMKGYWYVDICYTDSNMDNIYIINDNGEFVICTIKDEYSIYKNRTLFEIQAFQKSERIVLKRLNNRDAQNDNDLYEGLKSDVKEARESFNNNKGNVNLTKDIKGGKRREKEDYGKEQALRLEADEQGEKSIDGVQEEFRTQGVKDNVLKKKLQEAKKGREVLNG